MQTSPIIFGGADSSQRCYDDVKDLVSKVGFFPVLKVCLLVLSDNMADNTHAIAIYFVRDNRDVIVEPGLSYGYNGTGPRLLKDTLLILMKHDIKVFYTVEVSKEEYKSIRSGEMDIQSLSKWDRIECKLLLQKWYPK